MLQKLWVFKVNSRLNMLVNQIGEVTDILAASILLQHLLQERSHGSGRLVQGIVARTSSNTPPYVECCWSGGRIVLNGPKNNMEHSQERQQFELQVVAVPRGNERELALLACARSYWTAYSRKQLSGTKIAQYRLGTPRRSVGCLVSRCCFCCGCGAC